MSAIRVCSLSGKGVCLLRVQIHTHYGVGTLPEGDLQLRGRKRRGEEGRGEERREEERSGDVI